MAEVICLGEALIDFVSLESGVSLKEAPGFQKAAGGAVANVAAGLARLGTPSAFLGKVGDDPFGRFLQDVIGGTGADTSGMVFDPDTRTGLAFISLTKTGERDFVFYRNPSADMLLEPEEVNREFFDSARLFHYGSITLISEPSRSATLYALELARRKGLIISCDPNLRLSLWESEESAREGMRLALRGAELVKICGEELEFLFHDADPHRGSERLRDDGAKLVLVTLGDGGCYFNNGESRGHVPAFRVNTVDTTGAGDGFMAGVISRILSLGGRPALESLSQKLLTEISRFANAVGGITSTRKGAIPALPSARDVAEFLAGNPPTYGRP